MKTNLAASASRSTTISDEANQLKNQIGQLKMEISQLHEDEVTTLSQESTMRELPMDEQEGPQEPLVGDGPGSCAASSASDYNSVSGNGIDDSVDTGGNVLPNPVALDVPIGPLSYQDPIHVGTLLSQLYDDRHWYEGTVTSVPYSPTHKYASWRRVSLIAGGRTVKWDTTCTTEDGVVRTHVIGTRDC
jgi:hypothetical protein